MRHIATLIIAVFGLSVAARAETYTVKQGDNLTKIAARYNASHLDKRFAVRDWVVANVEYLTAAYRVTCRHVSEQSQTDGSRKSAFCNKAYGGKYDPALNSLRPGQPLAIPSVSVPHSIESTIREATLPGESVILVVDITASMGDVMSGRSNIQRVADAYNRGLVTQGRSVFGILGFTGHEVVEINSQGLSTIETRGDRENTCQAYLAAQEKARGIAAKAVIISDERGDDWKLCDGKPLALPVIAHCLRRGGDGDYECRSSLKALVARVPGSRYVEGFDERSSQPPLASSDIVVGSNKVPPVKRVRPSTPPAQTDGPWYKGIFGQ